MTGSSDFYDHPHHQQQHPRLRSPQHHSRAWLARQEIWKLEQNIVGSLVELVADPPIDTTIVEDNPLFHLVKDDHLDIFSFSNKPEYYGGVKVIFADHPQPSGVDQQNQQHPPQNNGGDEHAVAVYVIIDRRTMEVVYHDYEIFLPRVPFIDGFVAFREIEKLESLVKKQKQEQPQYTPAAILVDGDGLWHVRRAGTACFLGQRTEIPTIGVGTNATLPEAGWFHDLVDTTIDAFLSEFHATVGQHQQTLAPTLSRHRGLILKKGVAHPNRSSESIDRVMQTVAASTPSSLTATATSDTESNQNHIDRPSLLRDLAPFCNGIGLFLGERRNGNSTATDSTPETPPNASPSSSSTTIRYGATIESKFPIIGCALIGQGGQIAVAEKAEPIAGAINPVIVSVGHAISLQRSVQICASLSVSSDGPEPVRQAIALGQSLLLRYKQRRQRSRGGGRKSTL